MNKEDAKEIDGYAGYELDQIVEVLMSCRDRGENVFIEYSPGVFLYSADINMDNAFLMVLGLTKKQYDAYESELAEMGDFFSIHEKYSNLADKQRAQIESGMRIEDLIKLTEEIVQYGGMQTRKGEIEKELEKGEQTSQR